MAEGPSNVRLVRCPKCENLLQELPDYSVYRCGSCGAVLRAKKKAPAKDGFLEKSDEERGREGSKELESLSEKKIGSLVSVSDTDWDSDGINRGRRKEKAFKGRTVSFISSSSSRTGNKEALIGSDSHVREDNVGLRLEAFKGRTVNFSNSSSSRTGNKEALIGSDSHVREDNFGLRLDQTSAEKEIGYFEKYRRPSKHPVENCIRSDDHDMTVNRSESVNSSADNGTEKISAQFKESAGSLRSRVNMDQWGEGRDGFRGFYGNPRVVAEKGRFSTFPYPDEGPSNYKPGSSYGYGGEPMKYFDYRDGPNRVEILEQNRAELLRKLNELKDQINRPHDVAEKPRGRVPVDRKVVQPNPYGGPVTYNVSTQPLARDSHVPKPPYFNPSRRAVPSLNNQDMDVQNFYPPPRRIPNEIPGYEDPFHPHMPRRPPHQAPRQYPERPPHDYFAGQRMDFIEDPLSSYPHEPFLHRPACSCYLCYEKNRRVPPKVPHTVFSNKRFPKKPTNPNVRHHVNRVTVRPQSYDPQGATPALHSEDPQPHAWPSDLDSDIDGFGQSRPRRVVVAHRNRQYFHPIAGGAPFISCYNCFELLTLPRKLLTMAKNPQKLRCGACSGVMSCNIENRKLVISMPAETNRIFAKVSAGSSELLNGRFLSSHGCSNAGHKNCSEDFNNSGYNFQSADSKPNLLTEDQKLNFSESEKKRGHTSSAISSQGEESLYGIIGQRDVSNSAELPSKDDVSPTLPASPRQDNFDESSSNQAVSRHGIRNESKRTDQDKVILNKSVSRQNSVKDTLVATEVEVSFNDYLNTIVSQDSMEVSTKEDPPRIKGSESFLVGLIKKGFKDFSRSNPSMENERPNVLVNGQPIPDFLIKKAEKLAGPIYPGNYWYDSRAGFWGVMGHPCLGIILPFIEEFNYPMPGNCAAGNTGVFVNGRELNQIDLDLLASRGLPTSRDKNYIVEISGKVLDQDSGKELDSLGKLAPTVEKEKRGFGMRAPKL